MAPIVAPSVVELYIWNHFTALLDGQPLIGGQLFTYAAESTTPKAAFQDPYLLVPHTNPIVLNDQGSADIFLDGFYHLRLLDEDGVLVWDVPRFTFASSAPPPDPGEKIMGSTDADVTPSPGAGVISIPGLVSPGFRCEGLTWTITTGFGTSNGLSALLIGDGVANDRWARITTLTTGETGGQVAFRSDVTPIEPIPYVILVAAEGGTFDATGALHLTAYWSALPADVP